MEANEIISSGLLEIYATGAASLQEIELVQMSVLKYPEVATELSKIESDLETYASLFSVEPDARVKDKVFARIDNNQFSNDVVSSGHNLIQNQSRIVRLPSAIKFAYAAAIALLIGSIVLNIVQYNKNSEINRNLLQSNETLASLKQDNTALSTDMGVVQNKYSKPVSLHGLDAAPNAAAKIFYMENTGEVYIDASNLPDAPEGKQYQLWGIVNGKPVDAGMILTSKKGDKYRIQKMRSFGKAEAFAVTLESEKGNKSPKGPMYVMGKM